MGFFKPRKVEKSYDIFSRFSHYAPGLGGMLVLMLLAFAGQLLGLGLTALLGWFIPAEMLDPYVNFITYPLMFIPPMLYASVMSLKNEFDGKEIPVDGNHYGKCRLWILLPAVSIATLALSFVIEPLSNLLPPMAPEIKEAMQKMMHGPVFTTLVSVSIFAPFFEEWLCRGMVLRGLLQKMHPAYAIAVSALFFAILHMNPWQALPAFIMGCFFGWIYYRTGSLKLTMLMHCVNNTMALLVGRSARFSGMEQFSDIMSPAAWWCTFAASVVLLILCILYTARNTSPGKE